MKCTKNKLKLLERPMIFLLPSSIYSCTNSVPNPDTVTLISASQDIIYDLPT